MTDRLKFKEWLLLGEIQDKLIESVRSRSYPDIAKNIIDYVAYATKKTDLMELPWYDVALLHQEVLASNMTEIDLPLLKSTAKATNKEDAWEYEKRTWYAWANLFATAYGWDLNYIAHLDVDDALALCQEQLVQEQLRKEWEWGITELSHPYDSTTKKSTFLPLPRPEWMKSQRPMKIVKIPKSMLPAGVVIMGKDDEDETA